MLSHIPLTDSLGAISTLMRMNGGMDATAAQAETLNAQGRGIQGQSLATQAAQARFQQRQAMEADAELQMKAEERDWTRRVNDTFKTGGLGAARKLYDGRYADGLRTSIVDTNMGTRGFAVNMGGKPYVLFDAPTDEELGHKALPFLRNPVKYFDDMRAKSAERSAAYRENVAKAALEIYSSDNTAEEKARLLSELNQNKSLLGGANTVRLTVKGPGGDIDYGNGEDFLRDMEEFESLGDKYGLSSPGADRIGPSGEGFWPMILGKAVEDSGADGALDWLKGRFNDAVEAQSRLPADPAPSVGGPVGGGPNPVEANLVSPQTSVAEAEGKKSLLRMHTPQDEARANAPIATDSLGHMNPENDTFIDMLKQLLGPSPAHGGSRVGAMKEGYLSRGAGNLGFGQGMGTSGLAGSELDYTGRFGGRPGGDWRDVMADRGIMDGRYLAGVDDPRAAAWRLHQLRQMGLAP